MFSKTKPEKVYRFKFRNDQFHSDGRKLPLFASQSANPVGRENILGLLKNYQKQELS